MLYSHVRPAWSTRHSSTCSIGSVSAAEIRGSVSPGWEKVRTAFAENFAERDELGASCCVTYKGEVVVDLCACLLYCTA